MAPSPSSSKAPRGRPVRIVIGLVKFATVAAVLGLIALAIAVGVAMSSLPSFDALKSSPNGQMIRVRAADGSVLISLGPSYGEWLSAGEIPQVMKDAMVAVEDRRFYMHPGLDPIGMARSVKLAIRYHGTGRRLQGASTITQQLARNIFLNNSYTFSRKIREAILSLALERKFSKQQILELYLNKVYFGGGAYGIDAASRKFFGHGADHLSLAEAAIIAGLVKAPSNYSPTADAQAAIGRAGVVLETMRETGKISAAEEAAADPEAVKLAPEPRQNSVRYFTDWALPQLDTLIDQTNEPIDVWTTLDLSMQRAADRAIRSDTPAGLQGAMVAMENDGAVRAMVGGKDYVSSIYNRATQAVRQPGSAWKLFVYLAALEAGHKPDETIVDEPVTIDGWSPRNDERRFFGPVNLRTAFALSLNTIAAKLGQELGFQTVADMARRFGITTPINTHPSMVLGTSDVRLIDMVRAFASISNKGVAVVPYAIEKVTGPAGRVLYTHEAPDPRVLVAPYVAAEMTDLLQTAVNTGTGRAAQIGRPVAGKTGTTSTNRDGWFLGFSSGLTTGVWMGRDDAKPNPGLYGGRAPATAFADFMRVAVADRPVTAFETQVTLPEWQAEPDDEAYFGQPDETGPAMVDENGMPLARPNVPPVDVDRGYPAGPAGQYPGGQPSAPATPQGQRAPDAQADPQADGRIDQQWLDGVLQRRGSRTQPPAPPPPAPPQY